MGNSERYIYFFVLLMAVNVIWLMLQVLVSSGVRYQDEDPLIGNLKGNQPLLIWSLNNFIFVFLILYVIFSQFEHRILASLILTIINSIIDFIVTWKFYFPPLKEIFDRQ
jgi:hypothetical protein